MGRYGPDEFLLVAPAEAVVELEPAIERLRTALADLSLQFEATERLPVTISAGLCTYPEHGASVTRPARGRGRTLEEAKASGGDSVRVAGTGEAGRRDARPASTSSRASSSRSTRRTATRSATPRTSPATASSSPSGSASTRSSISTIQLAGLLHDVGKIGIPDPILRKPGRLTAAEYAIVKQHVALGDMIVRDVPDIELVRAGIRHHHERWDGDGYLDRLAGEEIPLIARILAVGDAFSAMTTTRPYRKALDVREALTRLEDAAGSQLDEELVEAFVEGIETAADAPLPGADVPAATPVDAEARRVTRRRTRRDCRRRPLLACRGRRRRRWPRSMDARRAACRRLAPVAVADRVLDETRPDDDDPSRRRACSRTTSTSSVARRRSSTANPTHGTVDARRRRRLHLHAGRRLSSARTCSGTSPTGLLGTSATRSRSRSRTRRRRRPTTPTTR